MVEFQQSGRSIEQILDILRRRAPWIILCVALVAGAAYGLSKHQVKKYTATAAVAFSSDPLSQQIAGLPANNSSTLVAQEVNDLEAVRVGDMALKTAQLLGSGLTGQKVSEGLHISGQGESNIIAVSATSPSPRLAAAIANTYVNQFVKEQQRSNRAFFKSALALVNKQLARLSPAQRFGSAGLDLQNRAHTLSLLAGLGYNKAQVAQEAEVPSSPSSPKTKRNTILGAVVGLLLGLSVAFLLEHFDRRIRAAKELEAIYGLPLLGTIPKSAALAQHDGRDGLSLPPVEAEAFSLARAHLRFFSVDREVRTILVASPRPGEGRTTIAHHLAEAAARLGSRVLLLEADMRRPGLVQQLEIEAGPGLPDVLIGAALLGEATQSVDLDPPYGEGASGRTLEVVSAGAILPPNPGELLESRAMEGVLDDVRTAYDFVVIDTPPLSAVSDAFALLTKVDGVVIVGWLGRSRRDAAERIQQVLAGSGARLLGVIANGAKVSGLTSSYPNPPSKRPLPADASPNGASSASSVEFVPSAHA